MKKLLIIFLLIPTLAISGTFKDEEGKFGLKTKKVDLSFIKTLWIIMIITFNTSKIKQKHVLENTINDLK